MPLPAREVGGQFFIAQPLEHDLADDPADRQIAARGQQRDAAINPMAAARQQGEAGPRGGLVLGLRQDAAAAGDDGVGGENERVRMTRPHGARLCFREAHDMIGRQFAGARRLVDIGRLDMIRDNADLAQQFEAARRGRGEHQDRHRGLSCAGAARRSA